MGLLRELAQHRLHRLLHRWCPDAAALDGEHEVAVVALAGEVLLQDVERPGGLGVGQRERLQQAATGDLAEDAEEHHGDHPGHHHDAPALVAPAGQTPQHRSSSDRDGASRAGTLPSTIEASEHNSELAGRGPSCCTWCTENEETTLDDALQYRGKRVVVTGCSSGMGAATADRAECPIG